VHRQLGRAPQPISRVAAACPFGYPAVVEDLPYDERGRPFPTLFYATCPTLVVAMSRLEDAGGVRRWSQRVTREPELVSSLRDAERYERRRRRVLAARCAAPPRDSGAALALGVAGVRPGSTGLKCLHAHAAHALARPRYLLGQLVLEEAGEVWCVDRRCADAARGAAHSS
jgi:hypothetical protein